MHIQVLEGLGKETSTNTAQYHMQRLVKKVCQVRPTPDKLRDITRPRDEARTGKMIYTNKAILGASLAKP